jgi:hypothetical protein
MKRQNTLYPAAKSAKMMIAGPRKTITNGRSPSAVSVHELFIFSYDYFMAATPSSAASDRHFS